MRARGYAGRDLAVAGGAAACGLAAALGWAGYKVRLSAAELAVQLKKKEDELKDALAQVLCTCPKPLQPGCYLQAP